MEVALTLLPVIGGYIFMSFWQPTKFSVARDQGHRLYFRAVFYGLFCLVITFLFHVIAYSHVDGYAELYMSVLNDDLTNKVVEEDLRHYTFMALVSVVTGLLLWWPLNIIQALIYWLVRNYFHIDSMPEYIKEYLIEESIKDNDVEAILFKAIRTHIPLAITMDNRKVYVGYVTNMPDPSMNRKALTILPLASGYREKKDTELIFTTDYKKVYKVIREQEWYQKTVEEEDFSVVLPLSAISSLNTFDFTVYEEFQE